LEDPQGNPELRQLERLNIAVTIITATLTDSVCPWLQALLTTGIQVFVYIDISLGRVASMRNGGRYSWILVRDGDGWKIRRDTADEGTGY
jgi:hypothetical protein